MKEDKVYCKFCRFLRKNNGGIYNCKHKSNLGDWMSPDVPSRYPEEINKRNDCKWFELDMWHYGAEYLNTQKEYVLNKALKDLIDTLKSIQGG